MLDKGEGGNKDDFKIFIYFKLVSELILSSSALKSSKIKSVLVNATAYQQVNTICLKLRSGSLANVVSLYY